MTNHASPKYGYGKQTLEFGPPRPLEVLECSAGFYLGTRDKNGYPNSRESVEYFPTHEAAEAAAESGDWTQRDHP